MLVVNYNGRLIHVISEDNKQKYRIPIYGVTTRFLLMRIKTIPIFGYNKRIKWLYK